MTDEAGLPTLLVLTDRRACERQGRTLTETVATAVEMGVHGVVLREKDLDRVARRAVADELRTLVPFLIVASDTDLALEVGADGVHLSSRDSWPDATGLDRSGADPEPTGGSRRARRPRFVVGRSCHRPEDVEHAAQAGAAYATLSPIFPTPSKPGYGPPLGLEALHRSGRASGPFPCYALGGITASVVGPCLDAGADGVAVMGAVMAAPDLADATGAIVEACGRAR